MEGDRGAACGVDEAGMARTFAKSKACRSRRPSTAGERRGDERRMVPPQGFEEHRRGAESTAARRRSRPGPRGDERDAYAGSLSAFM